MDLLIQKSEIRKQKKAKRDGLTGEERRKRSHQICEALWQSPLLQEAQTVYCYAPVGSEVDI